MDFELSDDQQALRDAARELLDDLAAPARVRAVVDGADPVRWDAELWSAMLAQGWLVVERSEADGGLGLGFVEVAVLLEELGRHAAPVPFLPTIVVGPALAGTPWADRLAEGGVAAVARAGDADRAAGRVLVPYAPLADVAVVVDADSVTVHDLTTGERPTAEPAMDQTRCVGWLPIDRAGATRVGDADQAAALLDRGAAAVACESLGGADAALAMTVAYAKERVQFGQPIGSFQAVKHRCADMLVDVEGMRSTAYHAAWCIATGDAEASVAASTAKAWSGDAGRRVMASALQVHGGVGFTWEHDLHLYLKRQQLDALTFGSSSDHRRRLAALLRERVASGASIV